MAELRIPLRLCGVALVAMGLWFAVLVPLHPNILNGELADAVRASGTWRLTHAAMFVVGIAALLAAVGVVALHEPRFGRLGSVVLAVTVVSAFATAATGALEATVFPLLARTSPDTIAFDGPLLTSPLFRALSGPWLLLPLEFAFFGWLARRVGDYAGPGTALAVTGVAFFAFGMWFVPVLGPISCFAFGGTLVWWGGLLWSAQSR